MKSTKRGAAADSNRGSSSSGHLHTLHQRLKHALSLGITRWCDDKEKKWQCTDIEIQRHVIRSLAAFLDCISGDASHHRLLKDSLADIVGALVWILQCKSGAIVGMAANMVVKLIGTNCSIMQLYMADLINPLSSLLCSKNLEVSTSCATALNMILSNLSVKSEKEVWEIVKEAKTVIQIIRIMREFPGGTLSIEYFQAMASLLSMILWQWPPSRFSVWNDTIMMKVLEDSCTKSNVSTKAAVLKLYSALALCNIVAKKLLENGETILPMMFNSMGGSEALSIRIEGFRLAQHLVADEHRCKIMTSLRSGPLVKAIIGGMRGWSLGSGKIANDQMSLLEEACRLALITRWPGEHHICFWEEGIDKVLLDLLLENFDKQVSEHPLSTEEQMLIAQEGLDANFLLALRPYIWEILGWLALHCAKDFRPSVHQNELYVDILITCACVSFVEAIHRGCQICENDDTYRIESSSRAVLMMMHSASTYIASKVRLILSGVLEPKGNEYLKRLLRLLKYASSTNNYGLPNIPKTVTELVGLVLFARSHSQTITVPISWEALIKLVQWFYGSELPNPPFGCLWDNMDIKERLYELKPYVELYWLAEFWILEDVQDACFRIVVSCLDSDRQLSVEVIKLAANFSLWKLVEVAAEYMAPLYHKLRDTGDLEELDELLVDLVRDASVRLSQERGNLSG
ncbi:BTB/POZ domain-containing protein At1g04390 [Herrania umbratica]|uniref:BTB/POZ domain-containing protein At1g04390 n=1 Tax=Herrania umbratica TaxID=108875 RepID=A0A6J1ANG8_9ROSI|nr:BTB/POZ domain-containing protein At1g04390 [Herrania umbratica]